MAVGLLGVLIRVQALTVRGASTDNDIDEPAAQGPHAEGTGALKTRYCMQQFVVGSVENWVS